MKHVFLTQVTANITDDVGDVCDNCTVEKIVEVIVPFFGARNGRISRHGAGQHEHADGPCLH